MTLTPLHVEGTSPGGLALDFVVDVFVGSDGAKYYGTLRNGVPSGVGTCIWPNNCHYDGDWRNGVMHGFGTYVWTNGQRYDGEWKDGRREGIGIKTYVDGSMYDGFWRKGKKHGLGVFRPAIDEPTSRRHSTGHGWQPAPTAGNQQQAWAQGSLAHSTAVADSSPDLLALERHHVAQSHLATASPPPAPAASGPQSAAAPTDSPPPKPFSQQHPAAAEQPAGSQQHQHQQQRASKHAKQKKQTVSPSPFEAAAAALNSDISVTLPATSLVKGQQWKPALAAMVSSSSAPASSATDAAVIHKQHIDVLSAAAADADAPSSSPMATGPLGTVSGPDASAPAGAITAAPRMLFVREYDMGQLLREYPLTKEEIKMIFGFLWPKNKTKRRIQKVLWRGPRMQKKLGEVVYKGHFSYTLMLELQLGIRYSVGRSLRPRTMEKHSLIAQLGVLRPWWSSGSTLSSTVGHSSHSGLRGATAGCFSAFRHTNEEDPEQQHYNHQEQVQQHVQQQLEAVLAGNTGGGALVEADFQEEVAVFFPSSGSSTTPAHPSSDYRWKDYCPRVFRRLRAASHIDEADYMLSLAGSQALRQLNSPGKSGSMFMLSEDERFLVKTMRKSEMSVLLDMLPKYAAHMEKYPRSLITQFFGLHKVTPLHGRSVRFVVMANIFVTDLQIHRRYDIKGSTYERTVGPDAKTKAADGDPTVIFKDLDVDVRIVLEQSAHDALMEQLKADCGLLREVGVMDYSLLLGVHFPARNLMARMSLEPVPSVSLDGIPHISSLGGDITAVPGSVPMSAQGSLADNYFSSTSGHGATAPFALQPRSTLSDDDVQQPPTQLQRLSAQQHQLGTSVAAAASTEQPAVVALSSNRSSRQSAEQITQQLTAQSSMSEDTQLPPAAGQQYPSSAGGLGPIPAGHSSTAGATGGLSTGGASAAGSQQAHMLAAGVSSASAKNWELHSGAVAQEATLAKVMGRMRDMGFSEQVVKDVAELAKLKILGGKLKKRTQRKEPPSAVLLAMQQQRQEAEGAVDVPQIHGAAQPGSPTAAGLVARHHAPVLPHLTSLRGAFTGLGVPYEEDEAIVDTPMALGVPDPKAPSAGLAAAGSLGSMQLGINMPALAVPVVTSGDSGSGKRSAAGSGSINARAPEEVVLCFGIIDILQDYSTRKVLERAVKGVTHDKYSISVAPPKLYAKRFLEFTTNKVFMSQAEYTELRKQQLGEHSSEEGAQGLQPAAVLQQSPWALAPPLAGMNGASAAMQVPVELQAHDTTSHCAVGDVLPLVTEDSFPYPPGQLGSTSSGPLAAGPEAAAESREQSDTPSQVQAADTPADTALRHEQAIESLGVQEPLLQLLAVPIGLDLTSPVAGAASGDSDGTGRLVSAEQVSVTVLEDGGVNGVVESIKQKGAIPAQDRKSPLNLQSKSSEQAGRQTEQQLLGEALIATCAHGAQQQQSPSGIILARG